jgi:hypothetical protein
MVLELDHIVVGAASLGSGRDWAIARLGVEPVVGGRHELMGTHNLLLRLDDPSGRERYLEIIATDPDAPDPGRARWFGLDTAGVQAALATEPRLLAWVARSDALDADRERLIRAAQDPGPVVAASRDVEVGVLRWRITVPLNGGRVADGAVPMLITWEGRHAAASLPVSGVSLDQLVVRGVDGQVAAMVEAAGVEVAHGPGPTLRAVLKAPAGWLELVSI